MEVWDYEEIIEIDVVKVRFIELYMKKKRKRDLKNKTVILEVG